MEGCVEAQHKISSQQGGGGAGGVASWVLMATRGPPKQPRPKTNACLACPVAPPLATGNPAETGGRKCEGHVAIHIKLSYIPLSHLLFALFAVL